jgi:polyphosphate glucokinase
VKRPQGRRILSIDIGASKVKVLLEGETEPRKAPTGAKFTPQTMIRELRYLTRGWSYDAVSIGFPGLVDERGPKAENPKFGNGWVGFNYPRAFDRPVRWANDAAMQAMGSYDTGRMLFLGLGTGVGSALVLDGLVLSLDLGVLPIDGIPLDQRLGRTALERDGKKKWRKAVAFVLPVLQKMILADSVVIGGGNSGVLKTVPVGVRIGNNLTAFRGGVRMWEVKPGTKNEPYWTFL